MYHFVDDIVCNVFVYILDSQLVLFSRKLQNLHWSTSNFLIEKKLIYKIVFNNNNNDNSIILVNEIVSIYINNTKDFNNWLFRRIKLLLFMLKWIHLSNLLNQALSEKILAASEDKFFQLIILY